MLFTNRRSLVVRFVLILAFLVGMFRAVPTLAASNTWSALDTGLNSQVVDIAVSSTGDMYPVGAFINAGGYDAADSIARWNGTSWSALGTTALNGSLNAIAINETDEIYIGGVFTNAGGNPNADYIAKWNGTSWSALGTTPLSNDVYSIAVYGNEVYAGGFFLNAGGDPNADRIARWNGTSWSALGGPLSANVFSIAINEATGDVYAGGGFTNAGGDLNADYIAKWDGTSWSALGTAPLNASVWTIAIGETGEVYAGGNFTNAGGDPNADYIAKWNGTNWSALGTTPMTPLLYPLYARDIEIRGPEVYVGFVTGGGGESAMFIARWDGSVWSDPGATQLTYNVRAVALHGTSMYAAGDFRDAGGDPNGDYIAKLELPPLGTTTPTVDTFTTPSTITSLDIPITAFTASDDAAVTGYLITQSSITPAATDTGWSETAPTVYAVGAQGTYTLYPWVKDAAGNVSVLFGSPVTVVVDTSSPCYVDDTAGGTNSGASWTNAYTDLQSALGNTSCDEIWVAAGTYRPTTGTDRTISFVLRNGVAIYGGFAGTETSLSERNYETNLTVLSGDIGIVGVNSDNSYHVLVGSNLNNSTVLDGFTITKGYANGNVHPHNEGGGMYNTMGGPTLTNLIFTDNSASWGGGISNSHNSSPTLTNVTFSGNTAGWGGGLNNEYNSSPTLTNVVFNNNSAAEAGGMMNFEYSSPTLKNVAFRNNTVEFWGGGMVNHRESNSTLINVTFEGNSAGSDGGGMVNQWASNPTLQNVTFSDNSATRDGGGMVIADGSPILTNVTFSNNSASGVGGAIANAGNPVITNSILWGNSGGEIFNVAGAPVVTHSIVQGGYPGTGNLDVNPLLGPLQDNGGFTQTMALLPSSAAIDAGDDANCPATDQRGVSRPQGTGCDVGAFEAEPAAILPYPPRLGDFNGDGKDDIAVFRPSNGTWYIAARGGFVYGQNGDIPVPGDYNGDSVDDIAVFRPSNGTWYISGMMGFVFGAPGDIPVPADYTGDGKDDIAVFRPSNGTWYIAPLGSFVYGTNGDIPVPGDYTGDGVDDIAVFRPSNGTWYISPLGGFIYGTNGDIPVPGDYTGDGVDDAAVFRPSNGTWYIAPLGSLVYGQNGDIPVPGNWNGDGRADVAVFRPSNGRWYIFAHGDFHYGQAGDIPI